METAKTTVDVAVLTYGNFDGLERTIPSILAQTQSIRKVILSDDGSGQRFPEEPLDILRGGSFEVVLRQGERNLGTVAHANAAARLSDSGYIKFLSPGDAFSDSGALEALTAFAEREQTLAVTSDCTVCSADLEKQYYRFPGPNRAGCFQKEGAALFSALAVKNLVSAAGTLLQRDFFTEHGGFDEAYRLLEDWPTWLRLAREGHRIPWLPRVTALYAAGGVSSENSDAYHSPRLKGDMLRCYEKEILPYMEQIPARSRHEIFYRYEGLKGTHAGTLWRRYPLLFGRDAAKRWIKRSIAKP